MRFADGAMQAGPRTVRASLSPGSSAGLTAVTFESQAVPGTLAAFAGTLSLARLDIVSATIRLLPDGTVSDVFEVEPLDGAALDDPDSAAQRLAALATEALNGRRDLAAELALLRAEWSPKSSAPPRIETRTDSALTTGINVRAADRPGLLHDIAATLSRHGLRTRSIAVFTFDGQAHDTFRVVDSSGEPPTQPSRLAALEADLARVCAS